MLARLLNPETLFMTVVPLAAIAWFASHFVIGLIRAPAAAEEDRCAESGCGDHAGGCCCGGSHAAEPHRGAEISAEAPEGTAR